MPSLRKKSRKECDDDVIDEKVETQEYNQHCDDALLKQEQFPLTQKSKIKDDADTYAEGWALTFRKLDKKQQILAKKVIDDVLMLGQFKLLNYNMVQNIVLAAKGAKVLRDDSADKKY